MRGRASIGQIRHPAAALQWPTFSTVSASSPRCSVARGNCGQAQTRERPHADAKLGLRSACIEAVPLTQRERECLTWADRGKSMEATAIIIGVAPQAVKFHLDYASANLGAKTLPQAVAIGLKAWWINGSVLQSAYVPELAGGALYRKWLRCRWNCMVTGDGALRLPASLSIC